MEKLIATRLYGFVEHHKLLDREHEGFRRYRGTSEALLKITQDIVNGINKKERTLAVILDIEKEKSYCLKAIRKEYRARYGFG